MIFLIAAGVVVVGFLTLLVITMSLGNPNMGSLANYAARYYPLATLAGVIFGLVLAFWLLKQHHEKWAWVMISLPFITGVGTVLAIRYSHPGVLAPRETNERHLAQINFPVRTSASSTGAQSQIITFDFHEKLGDRLILWIPKGLKQLEKDSFLKTQDEEALKGGSPASLASIGTDGWYSGGTKINLTAQRGKKGALEKLMGSSTNSECASKTQHSPSGTIETLKVDGTTIHYLVARYGKTGTAWILLLISSVDKWSQDSLDAARLLISFEQSL